MCASWFAIQVKVWTPRRLIACSTRSTRPSPAEWAWGLQSVDRLSKGWADSSRLARMSPAAPSLNSAYPSNKRAPRRSEHFTVPTQVQGSRRIAVHVSAFDAVDGSSTGTEVPWMWARLRPPRFGGANHASGHDNRSRYRQVWGVLFCHCGGVRFAPKADK